MRIVPIAVANYYINGVSPEQTIKYHHSRKNYPELCLADGGPIEAHGIYDFCKRVKIQGKDTLLSTNYYENEVLPRVEQKMTRYYISNKGRNLVKIMPPRAKATGEFDKRKKDIPNQFECFDIDEYKVIPPRESRIEAGKTITIFNKFEEKDFSEYDVSTDYYLEKVYKIINAIG